MARILISPAKYVQGKGELHNLAKHLQNFGRKFCFFVSPSGLKRVQPAILDGFRNFQDSNVAFEIFYGECSENEIQRLIKCSAGADAVIGVGGGKILDTAKAVGYYSKRPVIIVPTIASTDAPCSALSVIYSDSGVFERYLFLPKNPDLVLVDTDVIAQAPPRLLISGMGDALATYFEARSVGAIHGNNFAGGLATLAASALAKLCYDTLMDQGVKAKLAIETGVVTKAVEDVIEANTLLSGIGFESCGLAAAHAIHNGLTVLKECHHLYHGEKVAFGTIVQLVLENAPIEELNEVIGFCQEVGLPTCLADMGLEHATKEDLMKVATAASAPGETIHNTPGGVDADTVYSAILAADAMGRSLSF